MLDDENRDFFISFTMKDREVAAHLNECLNEAGFSTWFHPGDKALGAGIASWMFDALNRSDQMLAIASPDYFDPQRGYSAAERNSFFMSDPENRHASLIFVKVRDVEIPRPFNQNEFIDLTALTVPEAGRKLIEDLRHENVRRIAAEARTAARAVRNPSVFNVEGTPNLFFSGREVKLEAVHKAFSSRGSSSQRSKVSIVGLAGMGKSTLAREYTFRFGGAGNYSGVWWISAEDEASILRAFEELGRHEQVDFPLNADLSQTAQEAKRWIGTRPSSRPFLLVFDNAPDLKTVLPFLPSGSSRVIITSRFKGFESVSEVIELAPWSNDETASYLKRRAGRGEEVEFKQLADRIGGLPLAAEQIGAYLAGSATLSPSVYEERLVNMLERDPSPGPDAYPDSVYAALALSVEAIREREHGDAAVELLELCAHLASSGVEIEMLRGAARGGAFLDDNLREALRDPVREADAFGLLDSHSLMRSSAGPHGLMLHLHRLLAEITRDWISEAQQSRHTLSAVRFIYSMLPATDNPIADPGTWERYSIFAPHISVLRDFQDWSVDDVRRLDWLLNNCGLYLSARGQAEPGAALMRKSVDLNRRRPTGDPYDLITSLTGLAALLMETAQFQPDIVDWDEVRRLCEEAWSVQSERMPTNHWSASIVLSKLAQVRDHFGLLDQARECERLAVETARHQEEDNAILGERLSSLATFNLKLFDREKNPSYLDEAYSVLTEANPVILRRFGPRSPYWARFQDSVAHYYVSRGDEAKATECIVRSLAIAASLGNLADPRIARNVENLAISRANAGRMEEAEEIAHGELRSLRDDVYKVEFGHLIWALLDPTRRTFGPPPLVLPKDVDPGDLTIPQDVLDELDLDLEQLRRNALASPDPRAFVMQLYQRIYLFLTSIL